MKFQLRLNLKPTNKKTSIQKIDLKLNYFLCRPIRKDKHQNQTLKKRRYPQNWLKLRPARLRPKKEEQKKCKKLPMNNKKSMLRYWQLHKLSLKLLKLTKNHSKLRFSNPDRLLWSNTKSCRKFIHQLVIFDCKKVIIIENTQ